MKAHEIFEGEWWKFEDTITLYHGTSGQLLNKIRTEGLTPPPNPVEYALEVLKDYKHYNDDDKIKDMIRERVGGYRGLNDKYSKALYFVIDIDQAKQYAEAYSEHGGEIAFEVFNILKTYRGEFKPRWHEAKPVVIEVDVPYNWAKTTSGQSLQSIYDRAIKNNFNTPEKLNSFNFEIQVKQHIPPSMITRIIKV